MNTSTIQFHAFPAGMGFVLHKIPYVSNMQGESTRLSAWYESDGSVSAVERVFTNGTTRHQSRDSRAWIEAEIVGKRYLSRLPKE